MSSSSSSAEHLSLNELFSKSLSLAASASDLSTNLDSTQAILQTAHRSIRQTKTLLHARGVFSTNEDVEDVSTPTLVYMMVDWVEAELVGRLKTTGRVDRLGRLREAKADYQAFIQLLNDYSIVPHSDREKLRRTGTRDPSKRREEKIAQFRWEKEVRSSLQTLAMEKTPSVSSTNDFSLIGSLLVPTSSSSSSDEEAHGGSNRRKYTLALLALLYAQAISSIESISQEEDLLRSAPPEKEEDGSRAQDGRDRERDGEETTWRLDRVDRGGPDGKGELMDKSGKPLRPFTVLPSGGSMDDRTRLQSEVFRASHRLPTMTIDEYLENEFESGRVITGGGKASEEAPTSNEILQLAAEQDGTVGAAEADEQKRVKDENWAVYTEENAKGAGNTMNRG